MVKALLSHVGVKEIARFTRQFSAMLSAALPMARVLDTLARQSSNIRLRRVILRISGDVKSGNSLSSALSKHPRLFDEVFCNMVSAGETGGFLEKILRDLADHMEEMLSLRRRIRGAMLYPSVVVLVSIAMVSMLMIFVVPSFKEMFEDLGGRLPAPTLFVIGVSNFIAQNLVYFFLLVIALAAAFLWYSRTESGRFMLDGLILKIPIVGSLANRAAVARFSSTLGTLLESGVPILQALSITSKVSGNKVLERSIISASRSISGGKSIAEPLAENAVFPPMVVEMISVGEQTGHLVEMLHKVSSLYQEEIQSSVESLTSILEPIVILILGVVVAGVLIAMYMPMFDLVGQIQ
ncbi:MAG: type II secretion system F family protein [Elusimicrobiota bacterium]